MMHDLENGQTWYLEQTKWWCKFVQSVTNPALVFPHIWLICRQCDQIGRFIELWAIFKVFGNDYFAQISHIIKQFL